jgi:hypothetical protein
VTVHASPRTDRLDRREAVKCHEYVTLYTSRESGGKSAPRVKAYARYINRLARRRRAREASTRRRVSRA